MGKLNISRTDAAELLRDPETFMLPLFVILLNEYGDSIFDTDPIAIFAAIEEDFNSRLPLQAENRINAGLLTIPTDAFYTDLRVFTAVCNSLYSGDPGDDLILDPVTLPEILWADYEMGMVRGREDEPEYSPSVMNFIRQVAEQEAADVDEAEDLETLRTVFIDESIRDMAEQLRKIKVPEQYVSEIIGG